MSAGKSITIVLASIDASNTIEKSVNGFLTELRGRGQVIVVDASRDGSASIVEGRNTDISVVRSTPGTLAPVLWGVGLKHADTDLVAFSTAQMIPRAGWLGAMLTAQSANDVAGVGGPIASSPRLSLTDRALYLLRYASYLPPVRQSATFQPPGDNALYRRECLLGVADSWREGFWEVEVHAALRAKGLDLSIAADAVVEFVGGCHLASALSHRMAHARRFGAGRSVGSSPTRRLARVALAPAVIPLLLARIVRNLSMRRESLTPWLPALPHLGALLATWSAGEAVGTLFGAGPGTAWRLKPVNRDRSLEMSV